MPRYSIVIPTRNGSATLRATLQTVLGVEYDDYEVVVCDNDTSDATRQLIDEIASPRIRYIKAPRPLAMSSNWDLAVSEARGDYITVLGDDDGLLPHAMREWDALLKQTGERVIRWDAAFYVWPNVGLEGQSDYLRVPALRTWRRVESREMMRKVANFEAFYTALPMIYNSIVDRQLLDDVRSRCGRVFLNRYSDVCSGFVVAHAAGAYASTDVPMTVAGVSRKSTGLGTLFRRSPEGDDWLQLNAQEALDGSALLPDLMVFPTIPVAETFLAVKAALFADDAELTLDRRRMLIDCLESLRTNSLEEWEEAVDRVRDSAQDDADLLAEVDERLATLKPQVSGPPSLRPEAANADPRYTHLNTSGFGVRDVADAARLCVQVLGDNLQSTREPVVEVSDSQVVVDSIHDQLRCLHEQVLGKEAALLRLNADLQEKDAALHTAIREVHAKEQALQTAFQSLATTDAALRAKDQALREMTRTAQERDTGLHSQEQALQMALAEIRKKDVAIQKGMDSLKLARREGHEQAALLRKELEAKHAALHGVLQQAEQLQQDLREKHAALHAALERCEELLNRRLWQRIRNAA